MRSICWGSLVACSLALTKSVQAADPAEPKAVIDKAAQAMGGKEKLTKFQAGTWKAKLEHEEGGQQTTLVCEGVWQGLDKLRLSGDLTQGGQTNSGLIV